MLSHYLQIHNKYSGLRFKKNNVFFFCSQCFPYSWIKKGLKTEIYEKIKDECNVDQNSIQADKIIRTYMMKLVCKTLFVNTRGYPVVCWKKKGL